MVSLAWLASKIVFCQGSYFLLPFLVSIKGFVFVGASIVPIFVVALICTHQCKFGSLSLD